MLTDAASSTWCTVSKVRVRSIPIPWGYLPAGPVMHPTNNALDLELHLNCQWGCFSVSFGSNLSSSNRDDTPKKYFFHVLAEWILVAAGNIAGKKCPTEISLHPHPPLLPLPVWYGGTDDFPASQSPGPSG